MADTEPSSRRPWSGQLEGCVASPMCDNGAPTRLSLSVGERARSFKAVSPGMLPPLAVLVALFIAFTAAQVWNDNDRAHSVVDREASALRTVVILAATFPGETEARLRSLIRSHIADEVAQEWPMMAHRSATLEVIPYSLAEALQLTLAVTPNSQGQQTAQREITTALENALDARRQRIIISQSEVNWVKWSCLCLQAVFALVAIAMVHSDNRLASVITLSLFGFGIAAALLLILAHDRPFTGQLSVKPDSLLQVMPALHQSARDHAPIALHSDAGSVQQIVKLFRGSKVADIAVNRRLSSS